jgi:hypothetical protein
MTPKGILHRFWVLGFCCCVDWIGMFGLGPRMTHEALNAYFQCVPAPGGVYLNYCKAVSQEWKVFLSTQGSFTPPDTDA